MKKITLIIAALVTLAFSACSLQTVTPIASNPGNIYAHH